MPRPPDTRARRLTIAPDRPADLLISRAHVVDPAVDLAGEFDVLIRGGVVAEIGPAGSCASPHVDRIDAAGLHLFPGFVDPHVHLRTPGFEHKEDMATGTAAAAAGGYTTVVAMPNTLPVLDTGAMLRASQEQARASARVQVGFLAAITRGLSGVELTDMGELSDLGAIGFTDDGSPVASAGLLRRAFQYQRMTGGVICLHEEDVDLAPRGVMHEGAVSAELGLAGIPSISESTAIERDAAIARYEGGRMHAMHVSTRDSVEAVKRAKSSGTRITCEATPHHLTLSDECVRSLDPRFKMNPPLRTDEDRSAVLDGLRSGTIDCIATDHAPHASEEKDVPFEAAPMGVTGLETAFAVLYTDLVLPGLLDLHVLIDRMVSGATVLDLDRPRIEVGSPANLSLWDLRERWTVGEFGYVSRSSNSAFDGRSLHGVNRLTVAAGTLAHGVVGDREIAGRPESGTEAMR